MSHKTPNAKMTIYSYSDRGGSTPPANLNWEELDVTDDITSITTQKSKSSPSGSFNVYLSPTKNWVNVISPNSWVIIAMANYKINSYDMSNVKMIGRVDTVRVRSSIDTNGNRSTEYVVAGRDWGQIFESYVNIDPAYIGESSGLTALSKISFLSKFENLFKPGGLASTTDLMVFSLSLMKLESASSIEGLGGKVPSLGSLINSSSLKLPGPFSGILGTDAGSSLLSFLPKIPTIGQTDIDVFSALNIKVGKVGSKGRYKDVKESFGTLNPGAVIGINSIWSIVNAHANTVVNEVFCDLSADDQNKPLMTLY